MLALNSRDGNIDIVRGDRQLKGSAKFEFRASRMPDEVKMPDHDSFGLPNTEI